MATTKLMTADELLALPDDGQRHELIDGELRTMSPTGDEHGGIVAALTISLGTHVRARQLGRVRWRTWFPAPAQSRYRARPRRGLHPA